MFNEIFVSLRRFGFGSQRSVPSLDGLRAVSIAFVLMAHLTGTRGFPSNLDGLAYLGQFGVRVFFVISGYLITQILVGELERKNDISLSRFYFRRTLRLFPASYVFIAVISILAAKHYISLSPRDVIHALTYTMNFDDRRGWPLGHLWSLGVEEQFYFLWPLTLRALRPTKSIRLLIFVVLITPVLRLLSPYVGVAFNFIVWADALATGCLLALLREDLFSNQSYRRLLSSKHFFIVPMLALAANYVPFTKLYWLFSETTMNVCIALCVDWAMRNYEGKVGRLLNLPVVSFVGVLSYSLYIWQQPFLNRTSSSHYCAFPLNIILAVTAAFLSYLCVEVPFLRLRARVETLLARRASSAPVCVPGGRDSEVG